MFSTARKFAITAMGLFLVTAGAVAQEPKEDPNDPVGPGVEPNLVVGPDAFGYIAYDSDEAECSFEIIDITGTGMQVASGDDVSSGEIALPGPSVNLYGSQYSSLNAATNGYITTDLADTGPDLSNDCPLPAVPSTPGGTNAVRLYPLHDDLVTDNLLFEYFASCPRSSGVYGIQDEGCYVFHYDQVTHFGASDEFAFQVVLYDTSYAIAYQHLPGNPEAGSGSTTGLQNPGSTIGLTYACNSGDSITENTAQCIYHPDFPPQPRFIEGAAGFQVDKFFNDGNPGEVTVQLSCDTGLPLQQSDTISEGDSVTFVLTDFIDGDPSCEITETVGAAGYSVSYNNFFEDSDVSCVIENVLSDRLYICEITNTLEPVDVEVTKWWMDEKPEFNAVNLAEATYSCSNEVGDQVFGTLQFLGDGNVQSFEVFPDWDGTTTCTVTENVTESGVETDDSECLSLSVTPGFGATCNIYNTRLYEGIPTLSQYGLALMALLMLGIGFVAFRRIA